MALCFNSLLDRNLLLRSLSPGEREPLIRHAEIVSLSRGDVLFEPGDDLSFVIFPLDGTIISLVVPLQDGRSIETATIGREGALGALLGQSPPAFTCGVVQMGGDAVRITAADLHAATHGSRTIWNVMVQYSSCLLAQIVQSVACNAGHSIEQRCARWLLTLQSRLGSEVLPVTHEMLSDTLGVQRTYLTAILKRLQRQGLIRTGHRKIMICDGAALKAAACECHDRVHDQFSHVFGAPAAADGRLATLDPTAARRGFTPQSPEPTVKASSGP